MKSEKPEYYSIGGSFQPKGISDDIFYEQLHRGVEGRTCYEKVLADLPVGSLLLKYLSIHNTLAY
jgi:hypothetical protein